MPRGGFAYGGRGVSITPPERALLLTLAIGQRPALATPAIPPALRDLVVVHGPGDAVGDLALTTHGREAVRALGCPIGSVFEDARLLGLALELCGDGAAVALSRVLWWGVQRVIAAGDVLVLRGEARWLVPDPPRQWRTARLARGAPPPTARR